MDIDLNQLKQLIAIAENANIGQLELSDGNQHISITCQPPVFTLFPTFTAHIGSGNAQPLNGHLASQQHNHYPMTEGMLGSSYEQTSTHSSHTANNGHNSMKKVQNAHDTNLVSASSDIITVTSPMVGTFYRSAEPGTPPLVNEGDDVAVGDTLCIVEAMKILHEVKAEQAGKVQHIAINDGDMVEYGQTLFELQPMGA